MVDLSPICQLSSEIDCKDFSNVNEDVCDDISDLQLVSPLEDFDVENLNSWSIPLTSTNKSSDKIDDISSLKTPSQKKTRSSWMRPDLVEKRVIRALWDISKDYFNDIAEAKHSITNEDRFTSWDNLIETHFPEAYKTSKLKILGQVCVNAIGWKFATKINSIKTLNTYQRKQMLKFGSEFREQKNSSKVEERKILLNHPIVKIGKLLYETSSRYECAFWKHIEDHKKSLIDDSDKFHQVHKSLIQKVSSIEYQGNLFS